MKKAITRKRKRKKKMAKKMKKFIQRRQGEDQKVH